MKSAYSRAVTTSVRVPIRALTTAVLWAVACLALPGCGSAGGAAAGVADPATARPAPELAHQRAADWINSAPLTMKGLHGRVVVLDVWTFG